MRKRAYILALFLLTALPLSLAIAIQESESNAVVNATSFDFPAGKLGRSFEVTGGGDQGAVITGQVMDAVSVLPIVNATVLIEQEHDVVKSTFKIFGYTDEEGAFRIEGALKGRCWVFAFYDSPSTPGADYLPGFVELDVETGKPYEISFRLLPGASLRFNVDDISFIENPNPSRRYFYFSISPQEGLLNCLLKYGSLYGTDIDLDSGHVIVPADRPVVIELEAAILPRYGRGEIHRFSIDDGGNPFCLAQGESKWVDLRKRNLGYNLNLTKNYIKGCLFSLDKTEEDGLYVVEERRSLTEAEYLISLSEADLVNNSFQECFANMRQAYLMISDVYNRISFIYIETKTTAILLVPFLMVLSLAFSHFLFERRTPKITLFIIVFITLLGAISMLFVGFKILGISMITLDAVLSVAICSILPRLFKEDKSDRASLSLMGAIASAFSIAKRNLRRRRFRTMLSMFSLLILVWSFVVLTSVSEGQGVTTMAVYRKSPSQGILVRKFVPGSLSTPFLPLEDSVINWLIQNPKVKVIAPKTENVPSLYSLFKLSSQNGNSSIRGVIGFDPYAEPQVTPIDKIIKNGSTFLHDDEGILISERMAENLGVKLGDPIRILNMELRVDGIFNPSLLSGIVDLDGESILPKKLELVSMGMGPPVPMWFYCDPNEIVILTLNASLRIPSVVLARVDILPKMWSDIHSLSNLIVLNLEVDVWASTHEGSTYYGVGEYVKMKGSSLIVPFLLILGNIFCLMLNSVYERKSEFSILSTVGLNPTHVALVFVAEGIIIGFIAGGFGYVLGLGSYRFFSLFSLQIEVVQKVSMDWGFAAVAFSIASAVIGTVIPAIKASILTTPSLMRKWKLSEAMEKTDAYWKIGLPVYIQKGDVEGFSNHLYTELKSFEDNTLQTVKELRYVETKKDDYKIRQLSFTFSGYTNEEMMRTLIADCEIQVVPSEKSNFWTAHLLYYGSWREREKLRNEKDAHAIASFIRKIALKWFFM